VALLQLHRSPSLTALADALADVLRTPCGDDPCAPEWVVVGASSAERWLTTALAERLGVCAHVRFLSPSTLLEEVLERTLGVTRAQVRAWRPERVLWRVLAALPARLAEPAFAPVRGYLAAAVDDDARDGDARDADAADGAANATDAVDVGSARAVAFARRLAECLARYPVGRPTYDPQALAHRLDAGEAGEAPWQGALWAALQDDATGGSAHLARLAHDAWARLATAGPPAGIPARLSWWALPGAAPLHVEALARLAASGVAVHAFVPAVTAQPLAAVPAHPLARSLGRLAVAHEQVLVEAAAASGATVRVVEGAAQGAAAPRTLLARLQRDVRVGLVPGGIGAGGGASDDGAHAEGGTFALRGDDDSLRVHACHGTMRQAEVLRDALLAAFDADPTLHPREVLVLTPDPAAVAPLVEAAFAARAGTVAIPVRVVDRPGRRANAAADVLLRLLALAAGRVDAVALLDLLACDAPSRRFGLDARAHGTLRRWVRESGVRWGLDRADRAEHHARPGDGTHSWRWGLDRLLLGWGLPDSGADGAPDGDAAPVALLGGMLPYDEVEGSDAELLGRFAEAVERVGAAVRALRGARPVAAWCETLTRAVASLLSDDEPTLAVPRRQLRDALDRLAEEAAPCDAPVSLAAMRLLLEARLAESERAGGGAGAVTVARLAAGRVVPARVIALVGVEEGTFPRPRTAAGFDLLARERRAGDADANAEDRLCVLEALLRAGERLIVTYTGRRVDTNEPIAPAVPIGELLDAVDRSAHRADARRDVHDDPLPARTLVEVAHPLQPFSPRAFAADASVRSHDATQLAGARALQAALRAERDGRARPAPAFLATPIGDDGVVDDAHPTVTVDELAAWAAAPAKALVARRLGVWLDEPEPLEVEDPVELDALARHQIRASLVERLLADAARADAARADGAGWGARRRPGVRAPARGGAAAARGARAARVRRGAPGGAGGRPSRARGARGDVRGRGRHRPRPRRRRVRGAVEARGAGGAAVGGRAVRRARREAPRAAPAGALGRHLALQLAPGCAGATSRLVCLPDGQGCTVHRLEPVADAAGELGRLLALYAAARRQALPLLPECGLAYAEEWTPDASGALDAEAAHRRGVKRARKAWDRDGAHAVTEGQDRYAARLLGHADPFATGGPFPELALRVWQPLLGHLKPEIV
jgi:exodeoxyribonuclease V gamma subunit